MRKLWVVVAGLVAVGFIAGPAGASGHTIRGDLRLHVAGGWFKSQTTCSGTTGYDDVRAGAQVTVADAKGKTIAVGTLGDGRTDEFSTDSSGLYRETCVFPLKVTGVPDSDFYSVEVAHRGELTYPKKKLEKAKWRVHLTLGS